MSKLPFFEFTLILLATCSLQGCQMNSRQAAVEEESRQLEIANRELQKQVEQSEQMLAEQDRQLEALRNADSNPFTTASASKIQLTAATEETQVSWGSVTAIQIHRLTSGLVPGNVGSERILNIVLQPVDETLELVKVAGELTLTASVVSSDGETRQIAMRTWSITDSRKLWTRGLVSSGFHLQLALPKSPTTVELQETDERLLVTASLDVGRDRVFSTSELFDIE